MNEGMSKRIRKVSKWIAFKANNDPLVRAKETRRIYSDLKKDWKNNHKKLIQMIHRVEYRMREIAAGRTDPPSRKVYPG